MRAAYDALPPATQIAVADLIVEHDVFWSRAQVGSPNFRKASGNSIRLHRNVWCGRTTGQNERHCICRRLRRTSLAGQWRTDACYCWI